MLVLPQGAVVVDLTVNEGGCVVGGLSDQVVHLKGVSIVHVSGYPKKEPKTSSEAYAKCLIHLLNEVLSPQGEILFKHDRMLGETSRGSQSKFMIG